MTTPDNDDDAFSLEVHAVVCKLGEWLREEQINASYLLPALAVVLGRVTAHTATDHDELKRLLELAINALTGSALEDWKYQHDN